MTPKDKAEDLISIFYERRPEDESANASHIEAKFAAKVVADNCLSVIDYNSLPIVYEFWEQVKQELEKL